MHSFSTSDPLCGIFLRLIVISNNKERKVREFWHGSEGTGGWVFSDMGSRYETKYIQGVHCKIFQANIKKVI